MFKSWSFRITSEMSPSARLIGYYIDSNERVVADSILLRIDDKLPTEVTVYYLVNCEMTACASIFRMT